MTWRGLRMAPEKVRRRELYHLSPISILALFFFFFNRIFYFLWIKCVSKKNKKKMKKSLKFWEETLKNVRKLRVNENKWTEYTKKLIKENPYWKCAEIGDNCNSMFRTMGEDWVWWDMQYGNQIPSWRHEWVWMQRSIWIHLQYFYTLARSPCTGVCIPISDQF